MASIMEKPMGGSDLMLEGLKRHVNLDGINIIQSVCDENLIDPNKKNILWQHLPADQPYVQGIRDKYFERQLDASVYVSHWQHEKYRYIHRIPLDTSFVIKNAIEPIEFIKKPVGKKKIIYASAPYRGLNVMLDAFNLLNRNDVELDVYSSTIIYGKDYEKHEGDTYNHLFDRASSMKNVNYIGYVPNKDLISAMQRAHILAYPCTFEETSCLTAIEAGAAGCRLVTTNIGGLPETCSEFGILVPIQVFYEKLVENYAIALNKAIDDYDYFNGSAQSDFYNRFYSWEAREKEWSNLLSII